MRLGLAVAFLLVSAASVQAAGDGFAYGWLDRCLASAETEARPSGSANTCMRDAVRICEFSGDQALCLSSIAEASNAAANAIVVRLPVSLPEDRVGSGFYTKRLAKVADPSPLLVCNAPKNAPPEHCPAMTAMWRFSSARALARMVETEAAVQ